MATLGLQRKDDDCVGFKLYRGRKRACRSKVVGRQDEGLPFSKLYRNRKPAVKSKPLIIISRKSQTTASEEEEEEEDYSYSNKKRRKILEDLIPGCGTLDHYEPLNIINSGAYGIVYRALDTRTGEIVAVKEEKDGLSLSSYREINILESLPLHPCIVQLKDVAVDDVDGLYMVMEYMDYDLKGYMTTKELSLIEIKMLMKQLLEGVKFLHQNMVMHRDIKPSNILVNSHGVLKLCDFGLSRRFEAHAAAYSPNVGTLPYRAPELVAGETTYSCAVDMWAVGCTMAELLTKQVLFSGRRSLCEAMHRLCGEAAPLLSEAGLDLVGKLLSYDPSKRIGAESALNHAWFQEST